MKRRFDVLCIAITILTLAFGSAVATAAVRKQACFIPFEWCQTGCPEIGQYSIESFASTTDAQAFIATLTPLQQETVRQTSFAAFGKHVVVAYRVLAGAAPHASAPIGTGSCQPQSSVTLRTYVAIETAAVEADHLSLDQRGAIALFSVLPVFTNDPNTRAILLVRQEADHGDTDQ
jgi:hypothetical protein